jgi:hypothetical protein
MHSPPVREPPRNGNNQGFAWDHLKLANTILDPDALEIFRSISGEEITASGLSRRSGIPIARCYRWLRKLESLGLLVSRKGRTRLYRSILRSISVWVEDDRIRTRIEAEGGATPVISESMTTLGTLKAAEGPDSRSDLRTSGGTVVIHFIEPSRKKRRSRCSLPIDLPAFLEKPPPHHPGRR